MSQVVINTEFYEDRGQDSFFVKAKLTWCSSSARTRWERPEDGTEVNFSDGEVEALVDAYIKARTKKGLPTNIGDLKFSGCGGA